MGKPKSVVDMDCDFEQPTGIVLEGWDNRIKDGQSQPTQPSRPTQPGGGDQPKGFAVDDEVTTPDGTGKVKGVTKDNTTGKNKVQVEDPSGNIVEVDEDQVQKTAAYDVGDIYTIWFNEADPEHYYTWVFSEGNAYSMDENGFMSFFKNYPLTGGVEVQMGVDLGVQVSWNDIPQETRSTFLYQMGMSGAVMASKIMDEYEKLNRERQDIISENRSRSMRGLERLPVLPKPERPMGYEVYINGEYQYYDKMDDEEEVMANASENISKGYVSDGEISLKHVPRLSSIKQLRKTAANVPRGWIAIIYNPDNVVIDSLIIRDRTETEAEDEAFHWVNAHSEYDEGWDWTLTPRARPAYHQQMASGAEFDAYYTGYHVGYTTDMKLVDALKLHQAERQFTVEQRVEFINGFNTGQRESRKGAMVKEQAVGDKIVITDEESYLWYKDEVEKVHRIVKEQGEALQSDPDYDIDIWLADAESALKRYEWLYKQGDKLTPRERWLAKNFPRKEDEEPVIVSEPDKPSSVLNIPKTDRTKELERGAEKADPTDPHWSGSQYREPIEETDYELAWMAEDGSAVILYDGTLSYEPDRYQLFVENDDYSGYVVEINGIGYEFVRSVPQGEVPV